MNKSFKKLLIFNIILLLSFTLFSERVVMVFPSDNNVIVLFDDNSWFYHSQISWYDMVDFAHYDQDNELAILEEHSYRISENQLLIKGIAMNTSNQAKGCEIAYTVLGENQELLITQKMMSDHNIEPGHLFEFNLEFNEFEGIPKYVKFEYIKDIFYEGGV